MKVQKPLEMCDEKTLANERRLLQVLWALPLSMPEAGRVFSRVKITLTFWGSTISEGCLKALILMEAQRENLSSTSEIVYCFSISRTREELFKLNM